MFNPGFFEKVVQAKWAAVLVPASILAMNLLPSVRLPGGVCLIAALIHLPCPTCGLLRAMVLMARLDFGAAFRYHPLVPAPWALAIGAAVLEALPARLRGLVVAAARRQARLLDAVAFAGLVVVGLFGLARLLLFLLRPEQWSFLLPRWTLRQLFGG